MISDATKKLCLSLLTNQLYDCITGMVKCSGDQYEDYFKKKEKLVTAIKEMDPDFDLDSYFDSIFNPPKTKPNKPKKAGIAVAPTTEGAVKTEGT